MGSAGRSRRAPLGGCDCYLLALEDVMVRAGQGRHVGVTVVEVGAGFSVARLRAATSRFAGSQPLLGAEVRRSWFGGIPAWHFERRPTIDVEVHAEQASWRSLAAARLKGEWPGMMRFDVIPSAGDGAVIMMGWSHLVLDARGIELAWAELARLDDSEEFPDADSRALPFAGLPRSRRGMDTVRPFLDRYWQLRESRVVSAGPAPARASAPCFEITRFSAAETAEIKRRALPVTGGLFALPWFLAVAMRAHAGVLKARGITDGSLECTISVQGRKRGARGPIFQNQVSQLHFALPLGRLDSLEVAARDLHGQFADMTRAKYDEAFVVMIDWMRRLPPPLYRSFLRREASGQIASFYHAHTGEFLPGVAAFCGGEILDGWHVPSVPQPPGTGLFFSERGGRLTASLCWREGVLSAEQRESMIGRMRADLLGG